MKAKIVISKKLVKIFLLTAVFAVLLWLFNPGQGLCSPQATPPFVTTSLSPNVLIIFDTSGSMRWTHPNIIYPDEAVFVVSKDFYDNASDSNDIRCSVIQISDDVNDNADKWLTNIPVINPSTTEEGLMGHADISGIIGDIKDGLNNSSDGTYDKSITYTDLSGASQTTKMRFFRGGWGNSDDKVKQGRLVTAKWVVTKLIKNSSPDIRFGLMKFNYADGSHRNGGRIVYPCVDMDSATRAEYIKFLNDIYIPENAPNTPLGETLYEAWRYFAGQSTYYENDYNNNPSPPYPAEPKHYDATLAKQIYQEGHYVSPIQYWCQKNFVILITDGESYHDGRVPPLWGTDTTTNVANWDNDSGECSGSDSITTDYDSTVLDDVAKYLYDTDCRPDLGNGPGEESKQNIVTYTIGFGGTGSCLLGEAADDAHGHGHYYGASDQHALYESLQAAINDILYRISSGTAVSVLSTSQSTVDKLFRARFHTRGWKGFLDCFTLPYNSGDSPLWEAGELLHNRTADSRSIYTAHSATTTTQENFDTSNSYITAEMLGVSSKEDRDNLINYIRGDYDSSWGYRDRDPNGAGGDQWKLGDIVFSTPAIRSTPSSRWGSLSFYTTNGVKVVSGYPTFRANHYTRTKQVIVGANDGMVHSFYVNNGQEAWAFVPHNLLPNLKNLANDPYAHNYYVDLTPVIADIRIGDPNDPDKGWKTVLMCGERQGGKAYFALDITGDSGYPKPLWEFDDPDLGESWSIPQVGLVTAGGNNLKWIGIFGSGYDNVDSKGYLFGIDMSDASVIFKIKVDDTTGNVMASPAAIDFNDNACIDHVYIGDMLGRMWRATVPDSMGGSSWGDAANTTVAVLTSTGVKQPIRVKPSLSLFDRTGGQVTAVYFGTGKFDVTADKTTTDTQSFYCVLDEGTLPVPKSDLVNSDNPGISGYCSEHGKIPPDKRGWYFDLPNSGERVTASSLVVGGIVFFTTFTPNDDVCGYGGVARLYAVKYDTGCAPDNPVLDVNGDNIVDATDTSTGEAGGPIPKSIIIGNGLPSAPVFDAKNNQVIVQTSDTQIHTLKVKLPIPSFKINYWREIF